MMSPATVCFRSGRLTIPPLKWCWWITAPSMAPVKKLAQDFPEVRVILNDKNLGFTGGNNVGMRDVLARGTDYLLLLNNDTIVAPNFSPS